MPRQKECERNHPAHGGILSIPGGLLRVATQWSSVVGKGVWRAGLAAAAVGGGGCAHRR